MKIGNFGEQPTLEVQTSTALANVEDPINEHEFLNFEDNRVQAITLDQLERTNKENRGDNRECPHGIYHYVLVQKVLEMCAKAGYDAEVYDLFATNNKEKQTPGVSVYPELEATYGKRAVEATTIRRVFANVRLKNFDDADLTMNLAISYTQKGIQVGFGTMVKVCRNQNMLGEGQFVSDYTTHNKYAGGDPYKTNLKGILERIGMWLTNAEHVCINDHATIKKMQNSVLSAQQLYTILGMLHSIRVSCDTSNKEIRYKGMIYPLNQMQLNKFTEDLLVEQKHTGYITAWSLYNAATNLYKPQTCEQNNILPMNMAMMDFLRKYEIF